MVGAIVTAEPRALDLALSYVERGWPVFPVKPLDKKPFTAHGFRDASADPNQVRAWWGKWPSAMVGVPAGPASRVWILDLDLDDGIDGLATMVEFGPMPDTLEAATPRGGRHYYFRWNPDRPITNWASRTGLGVDVRGQGGYFIAPGSVRADGRVYTWSNPPPFFEPLEAPDWLLEALDTLKALEKKPAPASSNVVPFEPPQRGSGGTQYVEAALRSECERVASSARGGRNHALNAASFSLHQLVAGGVLDAQRVEAELLRAAQACGLVADDGEAAVCKTIASGAKAGRGSPRGVPEQPASVDKFHGAVARALGLARDLHPEADAEPPRLSDWIRPFQWREPASIPPREWLHDGHYIRRFVTTTLGSGGGGKSAKAVIDALAMASGKALLGVKPVRRCRVWYWNGEDPLEETERRIAAACLHYGLEATDLEGWLFIGSGRDADLIMAKQTRDGAKINEPHVEALRAMLLERQVDVAILDPFVSTHQVTENDNGAIDLVVKRFARIADAANASIELIHHMRKRPSGGGDAEMSVEDGRGAVALIAAARSARVLNPMSKAEAGSACIENRRPYFRLDNGKANLAPPPEGSAWFRFISVDLGNGATGLAAGDSVGVVTAWEWPDHSKGLRPEDLLRVQQKIASGTWKADVQSPDWAGYAVGEVLGLDAKGPGKGRVKQLLKSWTNGTALVIVKRKDAKGTVRPHVEVGTWVSATDEVFQ